MGVRRGHGGGAGARRVVLQPVRHDRRDLPGPGAGLAAGRAQLAHRPVGARAVRGGDRLCAAGGLFVRGPLPGRGDGGRVRGGGNCGGLAAPGAAPYRRGGRGGVVPAAGCGPPAEPPPVVGHVPERPAHAGGRGADQAAQRARRDLRAGDGRGSAVAVRPGRLGRVRARPGRRHLRDLPAWRPGRGADHGRARGGGDAGHRRHLARRAAPDPAAGLGLRALPGRPGGRVLPGRRRGAAAGFAAPPAALRRVRGAADAAGRDRGVRLRGRVGADVGVRRGVRLRRARRADPGLDARPACCWPRRWRLSCWPGGGRGVVLVGSRLGDPWASRVRAVAAAPGSGRSAWSRRSR